MEWPFYPRPFPGESLSGFIQRFAEANDVSAISLLRMLEFKYYRCSKNIDSMPDNRANLTIFSDIANLEISEIRKLTFIPLLQKLGVYPQSSKPQVLRGLISLKRRYCPLCLEEKPYYKLLWQVEEITICDKHHIKLIKKCPTCDSEMPLLSKKAKVGKCSLCKGSLSGCSIEAVGEQEIRSQIGLYNDWGFLTDPFKSITKVVPGLDLNASIALAKLYIDLDRPLTVTRDLIKRYSEQERMLVAFIIKRLRTGSHFFHIKALLETVRKNNMTLEEFSQIKIPEEFINEVMNVIPKRQLARDLRCLAPWCVSYDKPESLIRNGSIPSFRRFNCPECGLEYAVNENEELVERGNMINIGWLKVLPSIIGGKTIKKITQEEKLPYSVIIRYIYYFVAQGLVPEKIQKRYKPVGISEEMTLKIIDLIRLGYRQKALCETLGIKFKELYYYLSIPEVRIAWNIRPRVFPKPNDHTEYLELVNSAIRSLIQKKEIICLKAVANELGVSFYSIKHRGFKDYIREEYERQLQIIISSKEEILKERAKEIIDRLESKEELTKERVYKELGFTHFNLNYQLQNVKRYISDRIKKYKQTQRIKKEKELIEETYKVANKLKAEGTLISQTKILKGLNLYNTQLSKYPDLNNTIRSLSQYLNI